jgi:hypothetical protein
LAVTTYILHEISSQHFFNTKRGLGTVLDENNLENVPTSGKLLIVIVYPMNTLTQNPDNILHVENAILKVAQLRHYAKQI